MASKKLKVTIDSNLINSRGGHSHMNTIEALYADNRLEILGAQRLYDEVRKYNKNAFIKAGNYENISEPFTIGFSVIGSAYTAGKYEAPSFRTLANIIFPGINIDQLSMNQSNDVMHIVAHCHSDSDVFLTDNTKDFINGTLTNKSRGQDLRKQKQKKFLELGVKVMTPHAFLSEYFPEY